MKYCKHHLDREAVKGHRLCEECKKAYLSQAQKIYSQKLKSNWEELNLKDLLSDANRMNVHQLAKRYRINSDTVYLYLKRYNIQAKQSLTGYGKLSDDSQRAYGNVVDLITAIGNVFPKKQTFRACI